MKTPTPSMGLLAVLLVKAIPALYVLPEMIRPLGRMCRLLPQRMSHLLQSEGGDA